MLLSQYNEEGPHGGGSHTAQEVDQLIKALQAGSTTGPDTWDSTTASGAPLKLESLDNMLHSITFKEKDIRLWREVPKKKAYNTVEEYLQFVSPGTQRGGFVSETELPEEEDSIYKRSSELVKFLGITKSVSLAMQMVRTQQEIGNIMQRETKNALLWILRAADNYLAYGDSSVVDYQFDGIYKQHRKQFTSLDNWENDDRTIDLRGDRMSEENFETGSLGLYQSYAYADSFWCPPVVLSNFVKEFHESKFIQPNTPQVTAGVMGQKVNTFASQHGQIALNDDLFIARPTSRKSTDGVTASKAPASPVATSVTAVADGSGRFLADYAGDYFIGVAAKNRYGESAITMLDPALVSVGAAQSLDYVFTDGGGSYATEGYVIYRSEKDVTSALAVTNLYPVFEISVAELAAGYDGAVALTVRDRNRYIPNTQDAFLIQNTAEVWAFHQLAAPMKVDLALLAQARRFMVLMYGTPIIYEPTKIVRYKNIGVAVPS